ncbi:hypothetical protein GQ42DRAFT_178689 [Ramicandelaber brevisporus]|nr:hypothetical protein GQ42DRAFT_178689 [Ramicandelaber brevisporus]
MVDLDGRFSVEVFARLVHSELLRNQSSTSDSLHIDNALSDVLSRLRLYRPVTDIDFIASLRSAEQWLRQRTVDSEYTENRSLLDFVLLKNVHGMLLVDGLNVNYWTDRAAGASLCDYAISHRTLLQRHVVLTIERLQRVYHSQFVAIVSNALIRYQRVDAPLAARAVSSDEMRFNGTPQPAAAGSSFDNVKRQRQRQDTTDYCSGDITSISGKVYRDLMPPEWINAVSHRILLHRHPPNGALLPGSARRQVQDAMARAGLSPAHDEAWAAANSSKISNDSKMHRNYKDQDTSYPTNAEFARCEALCNALLPATSTIDVLAALSALIAWLEEVTPFELSFVRDTPHSSISRLGLRSDAVLCTPGVMHSLSNLVTRESSIQVVSAVCRLVFMMLFNSNGDIHASIPEPLFRTIAQSVSISERSDICTEMNMNAIGVIACLFDSSSSHLFHSLLDTGIMSSVKAIINDKWQIPKLRAQALFFLSSCIFSARGRPDKPNVDFSIPEGVYLAGYANKVFLDAAIDNEAERCVVEAGLSGISVLIESDLCSYPTDERLFARVCSLLDPSAVTKEMPAPPPSAFKVLAEMVRAGQETFRKQVLASGVLENVAWHAINGTVSSRIYAFEIIGNISAVESRAAVLFLDANMLGVLTGYIRERNPQLLYTTALCGAVSNLMNNAVVIRPAGVEDAEIVAAFDAIRQLVLSNIDPATISDGCDALCRLDFVRFAPLLKQRSPIPALIERLDVQQTNNPAQAARAAYACMAFCLNGQPYTDDILRRGGVQRLVALMSHESDFVSRYAIIACSTLFQYEGRATYDLSASGYLKSLLAVCSRAQPSYKLCNAAFKALDSVVPHIEPVHLEKIWSFIQTLLLDAHLGLTLNSASSLAQRVLLHSSFSTDSTKFPQSDGRILVHMIAYAKDNMNSSNARTMSTVQNILQFLFNLLMITDSGTTVADFLVACGVTELFPLLTALPFNTIPLSGLAAMAEVIKGVRTRRQQVINAIAASKLYSWLNDILYADYVRVSVALRRAALNIITSHLACTSLPLNTNLVSSMLKGVKRILRNESNGFERQQLASECGKIVSKLIIRFRLEDVRYSRLIEQSCAAISAGGSSGDVVVDLMFLNAALASPRILVDGSFNKLLLSLLPTLLSPDSTNDMCRILSLEVARCILTSCLNFDTKEHTKHLGHLVASVHDYLVVQHGCFRKNALDCLRVLFSAPDVDLDEDMISKIVDIVDACLKRIMPSTATALSSTITFASTEIKRFSALSSKFVLSLINCFEWLCTTGNSDAILHLSGCVKTAFITLPALQACSAAPALMQSFKHPRYAVRLNAVTFAEVLCSKNPPLCRRLYQLGLLDELESILRNPHSCDMIRRTAVKLVGSIVTALEHSPSAEFAAGVMSTLASDVTTWVHEQSTSDAQDTLISLERRLPQDSDLISSSGSIQSIVTQLETADMASRAFHSAVRITEWMCTQCESTIRAFWRPTIMTRFCALAVDASASIELRRAALMSLSSLIWQNPERADQLLEVLNWQKLADLVISGNNNNNNRTVSPWYVRDSVIQLMSTLCAVPAIGIPDVDLRRVVDCFKVATSGPGAGVYVFQCMDDVLRNAAHANSMERYSRLGFVDHLQDVGFQRQTNWPHMMLGLHGLSLATLPLGARATILSYGHHIHNLCEILEDDHSDYEGHVREVVTRSITWYLEATAIHLSGLPLPNANPAAIEKAIIDTNLAIKMMLLALECDADVAGDVLSLTITNLVNRHDMINVRYAEHLITSKVCEILKAIYLKALAEGVSDVAILVLELVAYLFGSKTLQFRQVFEHEFGIDTLETAAIKSGLTKVAEVASHALEDFFGGSDADRAFEDLDTPRLLGYEELYELYGW